MEPYINAGKELFRDPPIIEDCPVIEWTLLALFSSCRFKVIKYAPLVHAFKDYLTFNHVDMSGSWFCRPHTAGRGWIYLGKNPVFGANGIQIPVMPHCRHAEVDDAEDTAVQVMT